MKNRIFRMMAVGFLVTLKSTIIICAQAIYTPYAFTNFAGSTGVSGSADGSGTNALFQHPYYVAADTLGNVYVTDYYKVRKISPSGNVTTMGGTFRALSGIAVDAAGNLYVSVPVDNIIQKITPSGTITTLAGLAGSVGNIDGTGSDARFNGPGGIGVDNFGNVYVADTYNYSIRKISTNNVVTTLAGGLAGYFGMVEGGPVGLAVDGNGNVFFTTISGLTIRKISPSGNVTTIAGQDRNWGDNDGPAGTALFNGPTGLALDNDGNVFVIDGAIRMVTTAGDVRSLAGLQGSSGVATDGIGIDARFAQPTGIAVDNSGNIYVADLGSYTIRKGVDASLGNQVDLVAKSLAWNSPSGGIDLSYQVRGATLTNDTTAQLYWATGTTIDTAITNYPIYTAQILAGYSGKTSVHLAQTYFASPPSNATYLQLVLDPGNLVNEITKTNNLLSFYIQTPDLVATAFYWSATNQSFDVTISNPLGPLTNDTTAQLFWASGTTADKAYTNTPIYSINIPTGFSNQMTIHIPESYFQTPLSNATYLQLSLDPNNLVSEITKTNNTLAIQNTFRHVVLVMMENRSFDHFLGWMTNADGVQSGLTFSNGTLRATTWPLAPYFQGCGCWDPDHSFNGGEIDYDNGKCDGWLRANTNDTFSLGYYRQNDLPFLGQAATNWTVCNRYFASIMAETQPNRIYQHCAQTDSLTNRTDNQSIAMTQGFSSITLPTIWDILSQNNIGARYYYAGSSFLSLWGNKYSSISKDISAFYFACSDGSLPAVSFVDPKQTSSTLYSYVYDQTGGAYGDDTQGNDDHPHSDIRNGESFLAHIYDVISHGPQWASTVLIINFDEWGGFFDHVQPTPAPQLDVPTGEGELYSAAGVLPIISTTNYILLPFPPYLLAYVSSGPNPLFGLRGFRVPCLVISPWTRGGQVNSNLFDHTSVLKLIENHWGLPSLTARDAHANDLTNVMNFDRPDFSIPPLLNLPQTHYGSRCWTLQILPQPDGNLAAVWDSTCFTVVLQKAPQAIGPWTDMPNVLSSPYILSKSEILLRNIGFLRFRLVR